MNSNKKPIIYLYAPNVFTGGGKSLLFQIIEVIKNSKDKDFYLILDKRIKMEIKINFENIYFCKKGFLSRILCELKFMKIARKEDTIIIFNNVAPFFNTKANIVMYLQHILFTGVYSPKKYSNKFKQRFIYSLYYLINKLFFYKIKKIFVQTRSMKENIKKFFPKKDIKILPFVDKKYFDIKPVLNIKKEFNFIYPANNYYHKNHINLLKAIVILKEENIIPSFIFTIAKYDQKLEELIIKYKNKFDLQLSIQNEVSPNDMKKLYLSCDAMIFPSKFESFGMPLIEAKQLKLIIIAPELDYVRDIIHPDFTFDAESPISIARAIKRFLNIKTNETKIYTADKFLDEIYKL